MTALKAHEVERFLRRPDLSAGIFVVYGQDPGLVREIAGQLVEHYSDGGMGLTTLEGSELDSDPGQLLVEAKTGSLFAEKRVIRVRNAGKALAAPLAELAADPGDAIVVVEAGNLAPKDALRALAESSKNARALPCYADSGETLQRLIADTFNKAGIAAEPEVAQTLRNILGNDRDITRRELEKLVLYAANTKVLTREDVLTLCADNASLAIDDISDAIGTGRAAELETALSRALASAVDPQRILFAVASHFAALRRWRAVVDSGVSVRDVLDGARPKPHFSRRASLEQQLRLWNDVSLAAATERVQAATGESRKVYALSDTVMRRALLSLARQAAEH